MHVCLYIHWVHPPPGCNWKAWINDVYISTELYLIVAMFSMHLQPLTIIKNTGTSRLHRRRYCSRNRKTSFPTVCATLGRPCALKLHWIYFAALVFCFSVSPAKYIL